MAKAKQQFGPVAFTGTTVDLNKPPSLRELDEADGILQEFLREYEGEVTPEIEGLEAWLADMTTEKFLRWGLWLRDRHMEHQWCLAQAAPYQTEADRIMARAKSLEASIDWSERRLLDAMRARNLDFVRSPLIEVKRQNNPPYAAKNGVALSKLDEPVSSDLLEQLFDSETTRHLVAHKPASFALDKAAIKQAAAINALPESLTKLGIGVARDEKIVVK